MDEDYIIGRKKQWELETFIMDKTYFCTHLLEIMNEDGYYVWKKINKSPTHRQLYLSNRVIIQDEDGSYSYVKNRIGNLGTVPDNELTWILLHV